MQYDNDESVDSVITRARARGKSTITRWSGTVLIAMSLVLLVGLLETRGAAEDWAITSWLARFPQTWTRTSQEFEPIRPTLLPFVFISLPVFGATAVFGLEGSDQSIESRGRYLFISNFIVIASPVFAVLAILSTPLPIVATVGEMTSQSPGSIGELVIGIVTSIFACFILETVKMRQDQQLRRGQVSRDHEATPPTTYSRRGTRILGTTLVILTGFTTVIVLAYLLVGVPKSQTVILALAWLVATLALLGWSVAMRDNRWLRNVTSIGTSARLSG